MISRILSLSVAALLFLAKIDADNLIVNGDFETGSFSPGWTTAFQSGGSAHWVVYSGTTAPLSSLSVLAPPDGMYAALSDSNLFPVSMILYQDVTIPMSSAPLLQFTYYYKAYSTFITPSPETLNYTISNPNQQFRVDIMNPSAVDPYSVAPVDVYMNLLQSQSSDSLLQGYKTVTFDLSSFAGQTIRLRFAVTFNRFVINWGLDDVSISIAPRPPTDVGMILQRICGGQTRNSVGIVWSPSISTNVVEYRIYKNGTLFAIVPASDRTFVDCNASGQYQVSAVNNIGLESSLVDATFIE